MGAVAPPVRSCLRIPIKPLPLFAGLGVPAVLLCLLKSEITLDNPIPLLKGGMVGSDDVVEGHGWC